MRSRSDTRSSLRDAGDLDDPVELAPIAQRIIELPGGQLEVLPCGGDVARMTVMEVGVPFSFRSGVATSSNLPSRTRFPKPHDRAAAASGGEQEREIGTELHMQLVGVERLPITLPTWIRSPTVGSMRTPSISNHPFRDA